ncbi:hypothetical protein D3C75_1294630 [compost metagenome]
MSGEMPSDSITSGLPSPRSISERQTCEPASGKKAMRLVTWSRPLMKCGRVTVSPWPMKNDG